MPIKPTAARELTFPGLRVHQWMDEWDDVPWDESLHRGKPEEHFYLFSLPALTLRRLCGIYRRSAAGRKVGEVELGIQRRHEKVRSEEIAAYVRYGFPWSSLKDKRRESEAFADLKKPGWLPTAVVVNVLTEGEKRRGERVQKRDLVEIQDDDDHVTLRLPKGFDAVTWEPEKNAPLEIIDGQHRLFAFDDEQLGDDYQLPVVAFRGLGLSWQAYLFYTINIKPKRINTSLAFDLYPLLRTEDWLEQIEGPAIYREARAQELVDLLYRLPSSPWHERINMLGDPGMRGKIQTQASWVRSLLATMVKSWDSSRTKKRLGGLFGAKIGNSESTLPWGCHQQAAFLIAAGNKLQEAVEESKEKWATALRPKSKSTPKDDQVDGDPAFFGPKSLLSQDQGLRGFLYTINDLCYIHSTELELETFPWPEESDGEAVYVNEATEVVDEQPLGAFLTEIGEGLATFDWRSSDAPGLTEDEVILRKAFRGSGGYRMLRLNLLKHLAGWDGEVAEAAEEVLTIVDAVAEEA